MTYMEIDHEIISMVFLPLPLIEGQLSLSYKTVYKYWLTVWRTKPVQEKCEEVN